MCSQMFSNKYIYNRLSVLEDIVLWTRRVILEFANSRIHVLAHPWTAMLLLWIRDDVTIVAIDFEWKNVTQTKQRHDMRLTSWLTSRLDPSLDDFPLWIRLDLDPDRVSSENRSVSKPSLESSLKSRLFVNTAPGKVHAKGQGQRSKVKVTEVTTQHNRFRTVTPVSHMMMKWYT